MKVELKDGKLQVDLYEALRHLSAEEKRLVADTLSCHDDIIRDVAAQILDGWTEALSHGAYMGGTADPSAPLEVARREVALRAGDVAKMEIEDLRRSLIHAKQVEKEYMDAYFRLYHAWGTTIIRPNGPDFSWNKERPKYIVVEAGQ